MNRNWIRAGLVLVVSGAASYFLLLRNDPGQLETLSLVGVMLVAVIATSAHRPTRDFLALHARFFFWLGLLLVVAPPLVLIGAGFAFDIDPNQPIVTIGLLGGMVVGGIFISLPRSLRRRAQFTEEATSKPKAASRFDGWAEAWLALRSVPQNGIAFCRFALPWGIALSVVPRLSLAEGLARSGAGFHFLLPSGAGVSDAIRLIWWTLPSLLVLAVAVPSFAIAWHRFVVGDPRGSRLVAWPDRAAWPYSWRLALMSSMLGTFIRMVVAGNTKDLAGLLGTQNLVLVGSLLLIATVLLFVFAASSFALVFPAIAVGDNKRANMMAASMSTRVLGRSYAIGFVLALLPFFVLKVLASDMIYRLLGSADTLLSFGVGLGLELLFFAAVASGASYLSRAYAVAHRPPASVAGAAVTF